jgi:hypothetical protein
MRDWIKLDDQMKVYSPFLRDDLKIDPPESNSLASTIAIEFKRLPNDVIESLLTPEIVCPVDRLEELIAFQSFMDLVHVNQSHPGLIRAQVITQNYIAFVYLGEALFTTLRKCTPNGSVTKRCCKFLTNNPVRAFRNAIAHANWKYKPDFSGLMFRARKGDDPTEPMVLFEVSQNDLNFWQSLARCVAYVVYSELIDRGISPNQTTRPYP